jgi:hypothetical protein
VEIGPDCTGLSLRDRTAIGTSTPHFASRSKMRNRRVNSNGNAFRSCCTNEEAIGHAKDDRWHGEEVHGRNRCPVVSKEGEPAFGWLGISRRPFHPTRDGSFAEIKTEHQQLAVDARSPGLDSQQPSGRSTLELPSASASSQPESWL